MHPALLVRVVLDGFFVRSDLKPLRTWGQNGLGRIFKTVLGPKVAVYDDPATCTISPLSESASVEGWRWRGWGSLMGRPKETL